MTSRITARAAARRLGIRRSTLIAWNDCGIGPLPDERRRYDAAAVTGWADEMSAVCDSDALSSEGDDLAR